MNLMLFVHVQLVGLVLFAIFQIFAAIHPVDPMEDVKIDMIRTNVFVILNG